MAEWLNSAFYSFDRGIFIMMNNLYSSMGGFLSPLFRAITFLGNGGWAFWVLGIILILFKKTRKTGLAILLAIGVGAIFTNVLLKNLVDRARPYLSRIEYRSFWLSVKGMTESEASFPSGHATVSMASAMAFYLAFNKKWRWVGFIVAFIIGVTRLYFIVHYATDVVAGFIVGALAGVIGYYLMKALYKLFNDKKQNKVCSFILNADIKNLFTKNK